MNRHLILLCTALAPLSVPAPAQKIPLEGDTRIVQLHDVGPLVRTSVAALGPGVGPARTPADVEEDERRQLESMAEFVRTFMRPPLDGEEDVRPLGRRHLAALARPEQQAWLEDLIRRQQEAGDHQIFLEVRQLKLADAQYEKVFQPLLRRLEAWPTEVQHPGPGIPLVSLFDAEKTRTLAVLSKEDAVALMESAAREKIDSVHAPRLLSQPMSHASMAFQRQIPYVKDFEEVVTAAGETTRVPVRDEILEGVQVSTSSGLIGRDLIGLVLNVEVSEVDEPIPTMEIEIEEGRRVTIELPTVRIYRLDQRVRLPDGGTGLFAVQHESGNHTVFLATVTVQK